MNLKRRRFIWLTASIGGVNLLSIRSTHSQSLVIPSSAHAISMGYVANAFYVDSDKFRQYTKGQQCGNCQVFTKVPNSHNGTCFLFTGNSIPPEGWCKAYSPMPGTGVASKLPPNHEQSSFEKANLIPSKVTADPALRSPNMPIPPDSSNPVSIAKEKCADLGFKRGSESFGNCVLRLSK